MDEDIDSFDWLIPGPGSLLRSPAGPHDISSELLVPQEPFRSLTSYLQRNMRHVAMSSEALSHTRAIYQLPVLRIVLLIGHDQGQERNSLACPRRHFEDAVTAGIQRAFSISRWVPIRKTFSIRLRSHMYLLPKHH